MSTLEVPELGVVTKELSEDVASRLAASSLLNVVRTVQSGQWELSAKGQVGVACVGDIELWITPKLDIDRLLFLVGYAMSPQDWRQDVVQLDTRHGLIPAIAESLWRQTERAVAEGLLQDYRQHDESSYVLRGRLRETDQLKRRFGIPLPMEIRHDEFTVDIAENQILLGAITRMLTVPRIGKEAQRRLNALRRRLTGVTMPHGLRLPSWQPTRLNRRYHVALRLAEIVWDATSPEHRHGRVHANGFLFDLWRIFEDFVTTAFSESLQRRYGGRAQPQYPCHLDEANTIGMKPDLVWLEAGRPVVVLDAKYKRESPGGYPNADLYQMLAYCITLGLPRGHLVYAKGGAEPARHVVRRGGVEIVCHALDLSATPTELLKQVDGLAHELVEHVHAA